MLIDFGFIFFPQGHYLINLLIISLFGVEIIYTRKEIESR